MLVIHGDKDYRVPFNQALELWQDLQRLHPEAGNKFLYFPDEGHLYPRSPPTHRSGMRRSLPSSMSTC